MHNDPQKTALIPAYNPDRKLLTVLRDLSDSGYFTVLVNDGSDIKYKPIFDAAGRADVLLTHERNLGKGMALKTGLRWIAGHCSQPCTIVTVDADGQHRGTALEHVLRRAGIEGFRMADGRTLNLLAEGRLVNLAAGNGPKGKAFVSVFNFILREYRRFAWAVSYAYACDTHLYTF